MLFGVSSIANITTVLIYKFTKIKVKLTIGKDIKAQRGRRGIDLLFL
jgi:hypothetical protein